MKLEPTNDRRTEKRSPRFGLVEISFSDPTPVTIHAELVEISGRGFRASHGEKALAPGIQVRFKSDTSSGQACVIWTHVLEGRCNSGFLVLP